MSTSTLFTRLSTLLAGQPRHPSTPTSPSPTDLLATVGAHTVSIALLDGPDASTNTTSHVFSPVSTFDEETIFQACSISKPVTALAVLRLVEAGSLRLQDRMATHLTKEEMDAMGGDDGLEEVTIEQLLSHTSGLSTSGFDGYDASAEIPTLVDVLAGKKPANSVRVHLVDVPGRRWRYSGGGYTVLQLIVERVTGEGFADAMQRLVLEPLGMTRSFFGVRDATERNFAKAMWNGSTETEGDRIHPELAAAGLWTTPSDVLRVVSAVQNALVGDRDRHASGSESNVPFLTAETTRKMLTPILNDVGLGWWSKGTESPDWKKFSHSGSNIGYQGYVTGFISPDDLQPLSSTTASTITATAASPRFKGIAIMTNSNVGFSTVVSKLVDAISHLLSWPCETAPDGTCLVTPDRVVPSAEYQDWTGGWTDDWVVRDDGTVLVAAWKKGTAIPLLPAAVTEKEVEGVEGLEIVRETRTFVLWPLEMAMRFTWNEEGERIVVLYSDGGSSTLTRVKT
ncbi:hypothetical protein HKX48_003675 [Thoreauomyces humboldtii]|nr:hypothetical protein HKX48_003675 [Thoreauomyces humboldtii]